jgi:hypothetical protein
MGHEFGVQRSFSQFRLNAVAIVSCPHKVFVPLFGPNDAISDRRGPLPLLIEGLGYAQDEDEKVVGETV